MYAEDVPDDPLADVRHLHADAATARPGGRTARVAKAVVQATLDELSEVGYREFRIESVAERAGVNKTTIYRRWGSRERLVGTALIETQGALVPIPDRGEVRADLITLLKEIRRALRTPWIAALIKELTVRPADGDGLHVVLDRLWAERFRLSGQVVERAIARGELPSDT